MKNRIAIVITLVMILSMVLVACTSTLDGMTPAGGSSTPESIETPDPEGTEGSSESSYDQIMKLLENPESALALSGIQAKSYESRVDIPKGLPVEPKPIDQIKVGWAASQLGSEFFEGLRDSAQNRAKELGMQPIDLQSADLSMETQNQQLDTFVTNQVDVILLNAVDLHSQVQKIKEITDKGIPIIVTGPTAAKPEYQLITAIISGSNEAGYVIGEYTAEKMHKEGEILKVGFVVAKLEDADSNSRPCGWIAGYLAKTAEMNGTPYESKYDAILEAYNIWSVFKNDRKYDLSEKGLDLAWLGVGEGLDVAKGQTATADHLVAHPDTELIVAEMDSMGYGVIQECKQQGKTPGEDIIIVTCANGARAALDYVKSGELLATSTNIPFMAATTMVDMVAALFSGNEKFSDPVEANEYYNDLPATSFLPTMAITPENVDQYYPDVPETELAGTFAKYDPWSPLSIFEYNELHKND